jgi:hypothetical protein
VLGDVILDSKDLEVSIIKIKDQWNIDLRFLAKQNSESPAGCGGHAWNPSAQEAEAGGS